MSEIKNIMVSDIEKIRLDIFVSSKCKISRSEAKRMIEAGSVEVNGKKSRCAYKLKKGDVISILPYERPVQDLEPEPIDLDIIYEDDDILVINKPPGMVVHPAPGNPRGTLVNAILNHCRINATSSSCTDLRPGIVHRLDKGTSGLMVVAKNITAQGLLSAQFKNRKVKKVYLTLVAGSSKESSGTFDTLIGRHPKDRKRMSVGTNRGKRAVTHWEVVKRFGADLMLVKVSIETGRTHQIRVHFSSHGMPVVGDTVYGRRWKGRIRDKEYLKILEGVTRPLLHAYSIGFTHPRAGKEMSFCQEPPSDFKEILERLEEKGGQVL